MSATNHPIITTHIEIGQRQKQEDCLKVIPLGGGYLLILCDGHNGKRCAEYVIEHFPKAFKTYSRRFSTATALRLSAAYVSHGWDLVCFGKQIPTKASNRKAFFDSVDLSLYSAQGLDSGTTLLAAFLEPSTHHFSVLNIGDSRAVWKIGEKFGSTVDHKPSLKDIPKSITQQYPVWIEMDEDIPRLNGYLALGRAIGDNTDIMTGCISRKPFVKTYSYRNQALKLILASDGLWDEVVDQGESLLRSCDVKTHVKNLVPRSPVDNLSAVLVVLPQESKTRK